jgi:hypothetical protein
LEKLDSNAPTGIRDAKRCAHTLTSSNIKKLALLLYLDVETVIMSDIMTISLYIIALLI